MMTDHQEVRGFALGLNYPNSCDRSRFKRPLHPAGRLPSRAQKDWKSSLQRIIWRDEGSLRNRRMVPVIVRKLMFVRREVSGDQSATASRASPSDGHVKLLGPDYPLEVRAEWFVLGGCGGGP